MLLLEEKIKNFGKVYPGNVLKVDSFLNHQIDMSLTKEMGAELRRVFADDGVTKVLTVEVSGIPLACMTALELGVPVVYAKKSASKNLAPNVYTRKVYSYTHDREYDIMVAKDYLSAEDKVLLVDDFLAKGNALNSLIGLVEDAGATVVGAGIAIEKGFQGGGDALRAKGVKVCSLAIVEEMREDGTIIFRK